VTKHAILISRTELDSSSFSSLSLVLKKIKNDQKKLNKNESKKKNLEGFNFPKLSIPSTELRSLASIEGDSPSSSVVVEGLS